MRRLLQSVRDRAVRASRTAAAALVRYREWQAERNAHEMLRRLDDRALRDLGLHRREL